MSRPAVREIVQVLGLLLAGVIHLLPLPGLLGAALLERLYGIAIDDAGVLLLLRHRALLFSLLGSLLLLAVWRRDWRRPALVAGLLSSAGFLLLAAGGDYGVALQRVLAGDVIAVAALLAALVAHSASRPAT